MQLFLLLVISCVFIVNAFNHGSIARKSSSLTMAVGQKGAPSKSLNIPRKMKRKLRSLTAEDFNTIYDPAFEKFINELPESTLLDKLLKKIAEKARELKVDYRVDFGIKAAVVLPNLLETAKAAGNFNTLLTAIAAAGLETTLNGEGPFTVFAPSDEAFAKIPEETLTALLADKEKLTELLTSHVVSGWVTGKKLIFEYKDKPITSLSGKTFPLKASKGDKPPVTIDKSTILTSDIKAGNGYIHVIDAVLPAP